MFVPSPGCPEKCRQGMEGEFPPWPWISATGPHGHTNTWVFSNLEEGLKLSKIKLFIRNSGNIFILSRFWGPMEDDSDEGEKMLELVCMEVSFETALTQKCADSRKVDEASIVGHLGTISSDLTSLGRHSRNIRTPSLAGCSTGRHFGDSQDITKVTKQTHQASNHQTRPGRIEEKMTHQSGQQTHPPHLPSPGGWWPETNKLVVGGVNTLDIVGNGSCKSQYAIRTSK